jgi:hypothetical protein
MKTQKTIKKWHQHLKWSMMLLMLSFVYTNAVYAQTTIFTESMGTVGGNTLLANHETANGFDNDSYTMTNGGATLPADIRVSSASSGYAGSSGAANVFFTTTNNQYGFAIEGIDASTFSSLQLQYGYRKESGTVHATFAVEFWNGSAWVNVANTSANLFNEAANAATGWYLSKVLALPPAAQISGLKIRFLKSGTASIRIDDVKLTGTAGASPVITPSVASLTGFNYVFGFGPSTSQSFTFTGTDLTGYPGNITVDAGVTAYEVSTDNTNFFSSVTYGFTGASLAAQTVYVRLKASQAVASYNLQAISITGGGASAGITASGIVNPAVPSITVGAISPTNVFSTPNGTPSAVSTFTVSGINLSDPLTISAVPGYEYSDNGGFTWVTSLNYITVTVNKTIQVRLSGAAAGTFNGTITIESLTALNSPSTISVVGQVIIVPTLTEIIVPQYMQGFSGTNNNRLPSPFRVTINNLNPNSTYRYYNTAVIASDLANNNGAGVPIFTNAIPWVRTTSVGLSTAGQFGEFDTDGSGSYTGWFILEPSGNAKFTPGNDVFMRIMLNDGAGGNTVVNRVTTTSSVKVINLVAGAGANNGTGIRSVSNGAVRDFIYLFDNEFGTGRPISGTFFESDGTSGGTAYPSFYQSAVEGVAKAWGTLIPNTLPNGIRFVSSYSRVSGNQLCTFSDADGVWPTGSINTVNPTGGTTALVLANADVTMQCFLLPYANVSLSSSTATEAAGSVITITASITGNLASPQTVDVDISGLGITVGDYSLSSTTINIPAGLNSTGTVTFTVLNDVLFEGIETATIAILNPSAGVELGFNNSIDLNITDNDVPKIVINEIMYNSLGADEEWVELYNNDIVPVTIDSTWSIQGTPSSGVAWTRTFPPATSILLSPGQYITVKLGSAGAFPFAATISLSSATDQLTNTGAALIFRIGTAIIDNVSYSPLTFTPAANGFGPSLSLNNPNFDNSLPASWGACKIDGTPNLVNFNCDATTFYTILSGTLNPEVFNATTAIWSDSPTGTEGLCPAFTSNKNFIIRNGNTVQLNYVSTVPSMNNLTINSGGKLFTNINTSGSEKFIRIFGNVSNAGIIGNGLTYDAIGLSIEGLNSTFSGNGSYNIAVIRKDLVTNAISNLTLNSNVNLTFPGTAYYNNIANGTLNLTVSSSKTLAFTDAAGSIAIDGIDGAGSGNRTGSITINGFLNIPDRLYAFNNNTAAFPCSMTINATGRVTVGNVDANITGNGGALGAFPITINSGGKLNITKILKVIAGDLNSNGGIVLKSTASQTALIDGSGAGNVTGDVLVERKIGTLSGYHFLSCPVQGAFVNNTVSGWRDDFTILSSVDGLQFIPGNTYSILPTVFEYDETNLNPNSSYGFVGATGTTDPLTPLKGFACVIPGNTLVDAFGTVNNGPVNYNVTKASDGLNIIGNPYPSPMNWTSFRSHNTNLETTYKSFVTTGGYAGAYGEYNSFTSLGTNGVGNIIASSQGFLVTASAAGLIQAINTDRTTDLNPTFFTQPAIVNDVLRLELVKNDAHDEIVIFFAPTYATDNFDALTDAKKMFAFDTDHSLLYSIAGNDKLAMNGLGEFNIDKQIPLGIKVNVAGSHQIIATDLSNFAPSAMIYLYDAQTGTIQNLRSNPSYTVNLNAGSYEGRFFIQFTPGVKLTTQNASCVGADGKVTLTYNSSALIQASIKNQVGTVVATLNNFNGQQTINNLEVGNYEITYTHTNGFVSLDYFTVAGLTPVSLQANATTNQVNVGDNVNFTAVSSTGTTTWNFGDGVTIVGNDVNHIYNAAGSFVATASNSNGECTQVIEIPVVVNAATGIEQLNTQSIQWLVANNSITVKFSELLNENATIELIDLAGKVVYSGSINKGQTQCSIPTPKFAEGIYLAKVNVNGNVTVKKLSIRK